MRKPQHSDPLRPGHHRLTPVLGFDKLTPARITTQAHTLSSLSANASFREDAANRIAQHFFDTFRLPSTGEPACALVRCFQTVPIESLPLSRRAFALRQLPPNAAREGVRCLALLATRGIEPAWNRVEDSAGHQAIPLPSVDVILRTPMIARLLLEMGIRFEHVVEPPRANASFLLDADRGASNIFHVERALGSPYIPAQSSFVHRYKIQSVIGMGGLLKTGEFFATILFSRAAISRPVAELFAPLAECAKQAVMAAPAERTFAPTSA